MHCAKGQPQLPVLLGPLESFTKQDFEQQQAADMRDEDSKFGEGIPCIIVLDITSRTAFLWHLGSSSPDGAPAVAFNRDKPLATSVRTVVLFFT